MIEILERFSYYGIYFGFGIYLGYLGYSRAQLEIIQIIFLFFLYAIPMISGTFAGKYGFKKVLFGTALIRIICTTLCGSFRDGEHPKYEWFLLTGHLSVGIAALSVH